MRPWIVVPIFNEAPTIATVVAGARAYAPVLVVDDGSSDGGGRSAREAGAEVIRHPRRLGKGQALRTGLAAARQRSASHVVTLDGDGQHAPADLPALLAAASRAPHAIVIGGRLGEEPTTLPADRVNAIRLASYFADWASGLRLADSQSGFRIYPAPLFDRIRPRRGGFVFETEVLVLAAGAGVPVVEVPVTVVPRAGRRSRFRPVADGIAVGMYLAARTLERGGDEVRAAMRLRTWWRHPRRRRAATAAVATLLAPAVLAVVLAQSLGLLPDVLTSLVRRLYGQERLDATPATPPMVERETAVAPSP